MFEADLLYGLCLRLLPRTHAALYEYSRLAVEDLHRHPVNRTALNAALVARIRELAGDEIVC